MMSPKALVQMQDEFSATLRQPLVDKTGRIVHRKYSYGMGAYHRQYWMRFFTVLQGQFPLLCRLLGATEFNVLMQRYLLEHPPSDSDLGALPQRLLSFANPDNLSACQRQALCIDYAFWHSFRAKEEAPLSVAVGAIGKLAGRVLAPRASVAIVREGWNLMEMRANEEIAKPTKLEHPCAWVVYRTDRAIRFEKLAPLEAELLERMASQPLAEALAAVGALAKQPELLTQNVGQWLERAVTRKHWRAS